MGVDVGVVVGVKVGGGGAHTTGQFFAARTALALAQVKQFRRSIFACAHWVERHPPWQYLQFRLPLQSCGVVGHEEPGPA